ncbi:MAG: LCP family protein [Cyanobacteria bacterium]|nr:LCP family protein [Cyanobacteria bacterium CG_2015-16_32_12]NCO78164.1 LCP family protein [Cyanobacteria bacterium CG_2015-22_32_23]NCQ03400.1 LCP family protein [Cyanobacteria bacterium CG_2015-09_32_10]NCS84155.1 LCP family protein [Cyanobacteria bacterium CG_2015-02_32_10]
MVKLKNKSASQSHNSKGKRKSTSKKPSSPLFQGFIWGGCFTVTAAISGFIGMTVALKSPISIDINPVLEKLQGFKNFGLSSLFAQQLKEPVNILVMGIDRVADSKQNPEIRFSGRSDTMLLVRFEPQDHSLKILSIPRDSRVRLPNGSYDKINSANAIGGIPFTKEVIEGNLDGITIDKYIRVTTNAFKDLIDLMGGVEVYVPMDMRYTDQTQGLYIDLKEGKQTLNGNQAEQFARFRHDNLGDIGRVQRQQILLKALREKLQSPQAMFKIPQGLKLLQQEVDSDLTQEEIFSLVAYSLSLDKQDIRMVMLPGRASYPTEYRLSYWLISEENKSQIIEKFLTSESSLPENNQSSQNIRIAIQNSTSNPELAKKLALFLEENQYQNVYISNNSPYPTSVTKIIVQKGDYESAKTLKNLLNFGELESSSTGDIDSEITIRVGDDAEKLLFDDSFVK